MFKLSSKSSQLDIFSSASSFLSGRSLSRYEAPEAWHNLFRSQVTCRIDEEIFRPLFCSDNGASNSSIRLTVGMMILKEARGWSDEQLFEESRYNLLVRSALGIFNMDDAIVAESTYYLLRKRVVDWEKEHKENLIEKVFSQVTKSQAIEFDVNGKKIRMDSKLIGSNIAWYSRYELIHETLRKAYPDIKAALSDLLLCESDIKILKNIAGESGNKVSYRSNQSEIESKMAELGIVIYRIISQMEKHPSAAVQTLHSVFGEHYQYVEKECCVLTRPKEEISADSVQSPHDTDSTYRKKDDNQVKGFSFNIAETCDGAGSLNLITDVSVNVASTADCDFLQPAIEATQEIVTQKIETVNADGAYHSVGNQDYCKENTIDLIISAIQGKPPRYDLLLNDEGELVVTDLQTNTIVPSCKITSRKEKSQPKWRIKTEEGKNRYFTQKEIDTCLIRKQIASRTSEELNVRNNVEATIFQLGYHYPNDKSRYRGLIKHKIWANVRCLWINFVRIMNFIVRKGDNCVQKVKNRVILPLFLLNFLETMFVIAIVGNFCPNFAKNKL
jgi:hypothetical protein